MIPEWEEKNLYFWFLPPYCPELNLIEILWNKIKYTWMPMEAYSSWEMLDQNLSRILKNFGKQFVMAHTRFQVDIVRNSLSRYSVQTGKSR
jgi:transposase